MSRCIFLAVCIVTAALVTAGPARAASPYTGTDYVALGDSYSSGVGSPGDSGTCRRSPNSFPSQWAARNDPGTYTNLACSGALAADVRRTQIPQLSASAGLITITVGGNDARFARLVLSCKASSDAACARSIAMARDTITAQLPAELDATYAAIRDRAPAARVVVLSYPVMFDTASADCGLGAMSLANRRVLNEGAGVLNAVIEERARAAGFAWSDVRGTFAGHGVCSADSYLNGLSITAPLNSYHPNQRGYTYGYLPALAAALA